MRWIWIDKFIEFTPGQSATSIKNVSLAEEHLHEQYPVFPIMPHSLIVEAMAQTAGILVGHSRQFAEKVVLAKISRATFYRLVRPGDALCISAKIEQLSDHGASTSGTVSVESDRVAEIELMFSHIDNNLAGMHFPERNFVFEGPLMELLGDSRTSESLKVKF
jgi:3-hydroxyacyl-[acyl-carrier-protein] dehydratase